MTSDTRFRLYSTDADPSVSPTSAETMIVWDHDPIHSGGIRIAPPARRGSVTRTLTGVVYQDFGLIEGDGTLSIAGDTDEGEWLSKDTINALRTAESVTGASYYFTDGFEVWKVRFQSMNAWKHQFWLQAGLEQYSYEIVFYIEETVTL